MAPAAAGEKHKGRGAGGGSVRTPLAPLHRAGAGPSASSRPRSLKRLISFHLLEVVTMI